MPYSAWPEASDLQTLLTTAQVWDDSLNLDLEGALEEAIGDFAIDTGYLPFKAAGEASERRFNAPGPIKQPPSGAFGFGGIPTAGTDLVGGSRLLSLDGGIVELASLTVDQGDGAVTYTAGTDFDLEPYNAPQQGQPYTMLKFRRVVYSVPQGVVISARWGYCDDIPAPAWKGVLRRAALNLGPELASAEVRIAFSTAGQNIKSKTSGPLTVEFQTVDPTKSNTAARLAAEYAAMYLGAVNRYRLVEP